MHAGASTINYVITSVEFNASHSRPVGLREEPIENRLSEDGMPSDADDKIDMNDRGLGAPMTGDAGPFGKVVLGPMSGYTSWSYRAFMEPFGVDCSVTEMVSAAGLIHNPEESLRFVRATDIAATGVQIFGGEARTMAKGAVAALELEPRTAFVDINMGCPVKKVVRVGAGSSLAEDPERFRAVIRAVKDAVDVPVTAKIRLGHDDGHIDCRKVIEGLIASDVDAVTVHARTVEQQYSGQARYDIIRGLGDEIPVPLIVSGDIYSLDDAVNAMEITSAAGVMIARGGVGNPFLITQISEYLRSGRILPEPSMSQQADWCLRLLDMTIGEMGEEIALARIKSLAPKFLSGCRYSRDYRRAITDRGSGLEDVRDLLEKVRDEMADVAFRSCGGWPRIPPRGP